MPSILELQKSHGKTEFDTVQTGFQKGFFFVNRNFLLSPEAAAAGIMICYCRTPILGGVKTLCRSCGEEKIIYKPCHNKSCPNCNGQENQDWLEFHKERLPKNVKYLHNVFVLPEVLNDLYLKNKKMMTDLLVAVSQKILKKRYNGKTGAITVTMHTAGSALPLHPHLHSLVMLGTYDEENNKFEEIGAGKYNVTEMKKEFEEEYRKEFKKAVKKETKDGKFKEGSEKIDIDKVIGFKVWNSGKCENPEEAVLKYFSKSVRGGPISNDRILKVTDETVAFAYKNEQTKRDWEPMTLGLTEFIRMFLLHVPAKGQKLVRNFGLFCGIKSKSLEKCMELLEFRKVVLKTRKEKKKEKKERGETMKYFCPKCGKEMKVVGEILPLFKLLKKAV